ncbi:ubiquinol-cytochrome-c reductase complex core protein 2 mitochondrial precursor [Scheffersomyces amazonensis]|uniref:ubiquinol-cytochrome-c reductase complex core protein 2 mitochondrial precursor n=1 Tax=Scheffersomyces amazonensis TaxID=1078765 RepID=UPI00315D0CB2
MLSRAATRRSYSTAVQAVVKTTARDTTGNLTNLTVVVNNSGSKAGKSGISHLLSSFNFLNTGAKSALRFTRESELLGGQFSSNVTRDAIVLNTSFLKTDLPYYVEALGNVLSNTSFRPHELVENVLPVVKSQYESAIKSNSYLALEELHELSFRKGLGNPLLYDGTNKITLDEIKEFAAQSYTKSNISVFASGAIEEDLVQFINDSSFSYLPSGDASSVAPVTLFKGKEARIRSGGESAVFIGVPIKPTEFAKYEVLSAAIGSSILNSDITAPLYKLAGVDASSSVLKYKDAGLFVISVKGSAAAVSTAAKQLKTIVDSADVKAATKKAELSIALQSTFESPLSFKAEATPVKLGAFNYVAIGEVDALPYADEL